MLQKKLVREDGPAPVNGDRVLWELMRDKRIYCWFDPKMEGDMGLGLSLPKGRPIKMIINPVKEKRTET